jgi:hypothetical protein
LLILFTVGIGIEESLHRTTTDTAARGMSNGDGVSPILDDKDVQLDLVETKPSDCDGFCDARCRRRSGLERFLR